MCERSRCRECDGCRYNLQTTLQGCRETKSENEKRGTNTQPTTTYYLLDAYWIGTLGERLTWRGKTHPLESNQPPRMYRPREGGCHTRSTDELECEQLRTRRDSIWGRDGRSAGAATSELRRLACEHITHGDVEVCNGEEHDTQERERVSE